MPMIKRCCFSKNLKAGSTAAGIWSLVWCVYVLSISVFGLVQFVQDAGTETGIKEIVLHVDVLIWVTLCLSFLTFLSSVILIFAVFKENARLMIPWALLVPILTILEVSITITFILINGFKPSVIAALLVWFIVSIINIYCELCVISHYQEVRVGRGRIENYLGLARRTSAVPRMQIVEYSHNANSRLIDSEQAIDGASCVSREYTSNNNMCNGEGIPQSGSDLRLSQGDGSLSSSTKLSDKFDGDYMYMTSEDKVSICSELLEKENPAKMEELGSSRTCGAHGAVISVTSDSNTCQTNNIGD